MMEAMTYELATCPRCGAEPKIYKLARSLWGKPDAYAVQCANDMCRVGVPFQENGESLENVCELWNEGIGLWRAQQPWQGGTKHRQMVMKEVCE